MQGSGPGLEWSNHRHGGLVSPLVLDWRATLRAETAVGNGVTCVHEMDIDMVRQ